MIQQGILNPDILHLLARIRHTNTLVLADWVFPYWDNPHFPAFWSGHRLFNGLYEKSKFLGASQSPERRGWRS